MASRNTKAEAQELIDFMKNSRPTAEFRIMENSFTNGRGEMMTKFDVQERGICARCGKEIWHIDYGNTSVKHTACEIAQEKDQLTQLGSNSEKIASEIRRDAARDEWEE